ncbi:GDP-L-fucose synthase [Roseovarius sp. M141]|uniref:GDP-L-fucose synthase family protein n=1 Tax=Roseovarius sp. M141 TaxID=2583806 RepID=UPI0020CC784E|nr:GDP-L-fucose synthase [Roseovarius sp. M141]MCQ0091593.1 GDP-L-fucose synthase [Roseovarius sp. M141]
MSRRGTLLLTGGNGMVGSNIREHPRAADWTILAPSSRDLDLTDATATAAYLQAEKPDIVIHAAGKVGGIQANMANPVDFLDINTTIGRNVIMGARAANVPHLINLASTCIYPRAAPGPLAEEAVLTGPLEPTNEGYALAKIMALRLCQYIRTETPDLLYKTLIPCNLYGRHDSFDAATSHMVPAVIAKLHEAQMTGHDTVDIWGDGTARREFMYAGDLADAVLRAAADMDALPDLMNVGVGHDHSVTDYYRAAAEVVDWQGTFAHDLSKPTGMKQKLCDTSRQQAWGWAPQTDLRAGMAATYQFFLERQSS